MTERCRAREDAGDAGVLRCERDQGHEGWHRAELVPVVDVATGHGDGAQVISWC